MFETRLGMLRENDRAWLDELGILHKPWLIFGSAPNPTLPSGHLSEWARVDINNSGRTAAGLGLAGADLTIRTQRKSWADMAGPQHPSAALDSPLAKNTDVPGNATQQPRAGWIAEALAARRKGADRRACYRRELDRRWTMGKGDNWHSRNLLCIVRLACRRSWSWDVARRDRTFV